MQCHAIVHIVGTIGITYERQRKEKRTKRAKRRKKEMLRERIPRKKLRVAREDHSVEDKTPRA